MAINLDGSDFVALDSDIAGDGTADSSTRPLDVYLEKRLDANARYVYGLPERIGHTPVMKLDATTGKPHLSQEYTTYLYQWWYVERSTKTITVRVLAHVDDNAASAAAEVTAKLQIGGAQATATWSEVAGLNEYSISLDVLAYQAQWLPLILWLKSTGSLTLVNSSSNVTPDWRGSTIDADSGGTSLAADIDEGTLLTLAYGSNNQTFTPLHKQASTEVVPITSGSGAPFGGSLIDPTSGDTTVEVYDASYIQIYSLSIETEYDDTKAGAGLWQPKGDSEMYAQTQVRGQHTMQHGANCDAIYARPRCVGLGPDGTQHPESSWPTDYHARWRWVFGDTGGDLQDTGVKLDRENSRLSVRGSFAAAHIVSGYFGDADQVRANAARATWDVTATVEQVADGSNWASPTSVASRTQRMTIAHYPTPKRDVFPLLSQIYWAYASDGLSKGTELYGWIWREGQLWAEDIVGLAQPVLISMDIEGVDITRPTRVKLDASFVSAVWTDAAGASSEHTSERLILLNLGTSIWEAGVL